MQALPSWAYTTISTSVLEPGPCWPWKEAGAGTGAPGTWNGACFPGFPGTQWVLHPLLPIRLNWEHKETCEMDWSNKVEAYNIDETCSHCNNESTQVQFYPHSGKFEER